MTPIARDANPARIDSVNHPYLKRFLDFARNDKIGTAVANGKLTIGFVRRGYSPSGGAENYLKRLARGLVDLGHGAQLFATEDWPPNEWLFGKIIRSRASSTIGFADELEKLRAQNPCHVLLSLERIWRCEIYRAGDGVHRQWLERRQEFAGPLGKFAQLFNRKHRDILRLEESLFHGGAQRIIANSQMVKDEIAARYNFPADQIDIVRNGVPLEHFRFDAELRKKARADLKLRDDEIALLFAGSGWERKGLRFAIDAVEKLNDARFRLFVAGRGNERAYQSERAQFLGELVDLVPTYAAADIFVLPTIYDPFSNACLEALACGLPVITTRANGFSEIVEDKIDGSIISRPNDIEALCDAILFWSVEQNRENARSRTEPAGAERRERADPQGFASGDARELIIERASQFDISKNVEQTLSILLQVAARAASTCG